MAKIKTTDVVFDKIQNDTLKSKFGHWKRPVGPDLGQNPKIPSCFLRIFFEKLKILKVPKKVFK